MFDVTWLRMYIYTIYKWKCIHSLKMLLFFLCYQWIKCARTAKPCTILSTLYHVMLMNAKIMLCIRHAMRWKKFSSPAQKYQSSFFFVSKSSTRNVCVPKWEGGGNEGGNWGRGGGREGGTREGPAWEKCENSRRQKAPGIIYTG